MSEAQRFIESYSRFNDYPENLLEDANRHRSHSPTVRNISNEDSLREYFGETVPEPPPPLRLRLKPDPKCRFILLETPHTEASRLNLTRAMFLRILTYHQVSSCFLTFITFFGSKTGATDVSFGGFRAESSLTTPGLLRSDTLGRSGRRIQLCYTLGTVEEAPRSSHPVALGSETAKKQDKLWIRPQASIHHQFDPEKGTMLWIITAPVTPPRKFAPPTERSKSKIWTEEFKVYMNKQHRDGKFLIPPSCFWMSLDIHLKLAAWSVGDFSYCMQDLDENIRQQTNEYIQVQPKEVLESDLQLLYNLMDTAAELQRCLSSNHKVLKSLADFYKTQFSEEMKQLENIGWKDECAADIQRFLHELNGFILEVESIMNRAVALTSMAQLRESVISKVLQNQTNRRMYKLTEQGFQEAVTMSLLQKIAFIYLPVSIISTIFGTDIVKFQRDLEPNQTYSWSLIAFLSWMITTLVFTTLSWWLSEFWKHREGRRLRDLGEDTENGETPDSGGDAQHGEQSRRYFWRSDVGRGLISNARGLPPPSPGPKV
ncbi:hypothetical protein DL764_000399 [Monosporascus ibericus]|uniref:CorA-like transporter domain-containing protein n=1 Tax=Monosporascus ibericus TaxID=155417 RepID=A0A4Q4TX38_9PEZI|nr:hypothetical protein DL764_000399 [Monosporascus ibericus]